MNSISNDTLEKLELYKKVSGDVVDKIENNMTYVETLLIYEIMNSNFFNREKIIFNYRLFSKLSVKKYAKLYNEELQTIKEDLVDSLNEDLKYNIDPAVKDNINNMIGILDRPFKEKFEEKVNAMIKNFENSLDEIIESNAALVDSTNKTKESENEKLDAPKSDVDGVTKQMVEDKKKNEEKMKVIPGQNVDKIKKEVEDKKNSLEKEKSEEENVEIESMLGAIDNIYNEMGNADLNQIDYTTFLNYVEEDELESLNLENIMHTEDEIEINENLSKTLDDLDLGTDNNLKVDSEEVDNIEVDKVGTEEEDELTNDVLDSIVEEKNDSEKTFDMQMDSSDARIMEEQSLDVDSFLIDENDDAEDITLLQDDKTTQSLNNFTNNIEEAEIKLDEDASRVGSSQEVNAISNKKENNVHGMDSLSDDLLNGNTEIDDLLNGDADIDDLLNKIDSEESNDNEDLLNKENQKGRIKFGFRKNK